MQMLQTVRELLLPAAQARALLLINHVLSREPAAMQRLQAHAGRRLQIEVVDTPGWLPTPPPLALTENPDILAGIGHHAQRPALHVRSLALLSANHAGGVGGRAACWTQRISAPEKWWPLPSACSCSSST
ncbi:MAG: hypothetical protein HC793_00995 [Aquincola sp.]|nr:hypothetical protein [Aquincola sp.]